MTRYAIPVADGRLTMHFGHADRFVLIDVDEDGRLGEPREATPPPHAPGVLPAWLKEQGADRVIAGGMGGRARQLFEAAGIEVIVGAPARAPEDLVGEHLAGRLVCGDNVCDH